MIYLKSYVGEFVGEFVGTLILVLFGCGSVAVTVLFSALTGLFQVAMVWGIAVMLAIYATRKLSCAHLNPAVSIAMVICRRMPATKLPCYLIAQFAGAFVAAVLVYLLFSSSIIEYESLHGIIRGTESSVTSGMIFGEYYPNPLAGKNALVSTGNAFFAEIIGTFVLVFMILALTDGCNVGRPDQTMAPFFIGLTLTAIISIIAPLTQSGLNPARDLSPRLLAMLCGWKDAAFPDHHYGFISVYIAGPVMGGILAALFFTGIIEPLLKSAEGKGEHR
ncbi:MFS transporter [Endozoicomonas montiporae]|uniref:MFS transporter n=2 Tax=Endozoicomonas montiporae TaxID=1027273 RepID=A0A081N2B7_9GAMM|nr:MIP/aquaporin family protein [Endozoicomonas montiporae]AMO58448.1 glycerol uptake facilitator protein [Endozoicomonas montiporae CL-33]KEQ12590.1 MFS transporter [Endozoicomonas montiporae]